MMIQPTGQPAMAERIIVISDTHLGRPHCAALSARALRPLWAEATHFIVNGDVAEVHHPTHWTEAARQTLLLLDLCEADGVQLTLLSGNHDPFISDVRSLHLADDEIFITHGDVLHPAVAPWSPAAARIRAAHDAALAALPPEQHAQLESRLSVSALASHEEWRELEREALRSSVWRMLIRPWAIARVLWYWRQFPALAVAFADAFASEASYIILGHTHRPGIWRMRGRTVINTGSFGFPGSPRAVVIEPGRLEIRRIEWRGDVYRLGDRPLATFALQADSPLAVHDRPAVAPPESTLKTLPGSGLRSIERM